MWREEVIVKSDSRPTVEVYQDAPDGSASGQEVDWGH